MERAAIQNEFFVEDAKESDLPDLKRLLASTVPECSPQTVWDLPFHWSSYRVVRNDEGRVIASGSLQVLSGERAEIRGLVVDPDWRGKGLANLLVEDLLAIARTIGHETVCVTRSPSFFERFGFRHTFPTWLSQDRHHRGGKDDEDPRAYMVSCDALQA